MTKYKGYYIDGAIFNSKEDIDTFIKGETIKKIKQLYEMMTNPRYNAPELMAISNMITDREIILHNEYGMTWEEIENIA